MKRRFRVLLIVAAGTAAGLWLLLPPGLPPPPDFTGRQFTSVSASFRERGGTERVLSAASEDQALIASLVDLLKGGRPVILCRCGSLGTLSFRTPDGTEDRLLIMPADQQDAVEYRYKGGRYRVSRERFLEAVRPLGIPEARWYASPDSPPEEAPGPGEDGGRE